MWVAALKASVYIGAPPWLRLQPFRVHVVESIAMMGQQRTCCCSQRDDRLSSTRLLQALVRPRSASAAHSATPGAVHPEACVLQGASKSARQAAVISKAPIMLQWLLRS